MLRIDIDEVLREKMPRHEKYIPRFVRQWLRRTIHEEELNRILQEGQAASPREFIRIALRHMQVDYTVEGLERLDDRERYLFVANHPFGGMDGMMIAAALIDRFGDIPKKVQQLLHIAALKGLAHSAYVTAVEQKGQDFKFTMYEKAKIDPQKIPALLQSYRNELVFRAEEPPYFLYKKKGRSGKEKGEDILAFLRRILEDIRSLRL